MLQSDIVHVFCEKTERDSQLRSTNGCGHKLVWPFHLGAV